MSWPRGQNQHHQNKTMTTAMLEDRINQYITAVDQATARNDSHQVSLLQHDIQQLVDLMERLGQGQSIPENVVPPPLVIAPQIDILPNPHVVLSTRLDNYHKALYFAEEELSENKFHKIQQLQRCLQIVNDLQERVQAGIPVRVDEVPPPVPIPSDDGNVSIDQCLPTFQIMEGHSVSREFDNAALKTLTDRIANYKMALVAAQQSQGSDKRHIPKIQSSLRTLEFLMTRAKANRPVWKKDIPAEFDYQEMSPVKTSRPKMNKAKFTLLIRSLVLRTAKLSFRSSEMETKAREHHSKLVGIESQLSNSGATWQPDEALLKVLTKQTEALEQKSMEEKQLDIQKTAESLAAIETRIIEYENAVVNCERDDLTNRVKQHLKSLLSLKEAVEKGETVDMELPPAFETLSKEQTVTSNDNISGTTAHLLSGTTSNLSSGTTSTLSYGATAHLSLVTIKPAVETPEDKLAKKLSYYLEKGDEHKFDSSKQRAGNVNLNTSPSPPPTLLPKVHNSARTERTSEASYLATPQLDRDSSIHLNGFDSSHLPANDGLREEKNVSIGTLSSPGNTTAETSPQVSLLGKESSAGQEISDKKEEQESIKPLSPSQKSTDIYIRKTLDSVGFLSCQNVPEHSHNNGKTFADIKLNGSAFNSGNISARGIVISNESSDSPSKVGASDIYQHQVQLGANETISIGVPSNNHVSSAANVLSSVGSPFNLSVETPASQLTSGPSSLPVLVQLSGDMRQSIHVQLSPAGLNQTTNTSSGVSPLPGHHEIGQTNKESINDAEEKRMIGQKDFSVGNVDISVLKSDCLASNILNEFQDLIESMSMPSLTSVSSNPETSQPTSMSLSNTHTDSQHLNQVMGSDETEQQTAMKRTQPLEPSVKLSGDKFDSENNLTLSDGHTVGDMTRSLSSQTVAETNPDLPNIISNIQGDHVTPAKPKDEDLTSSLGTEPKDSENVVSVGLPKLEFPTVKQVTQDGHKSEYLSTSQRSDDRLATINNLQNGVALTCLENLKYHFLIEEAKGTPESLREANLLRERFDQLKQRLSNGKLHLWEEYRECVESELTSLVQRIEEKRLVQRWSEVKVLCEMKTIAERELVILRERLPELMY